jgi:dTDP-6-deoxy-L-talose 4-dehydrogenase (NAD+)
VNILLTGPTGFIGSAFARLALERGHRVGGLVIPGETIPQGLAGREQLSWFRGTLETAPWAEIGPFAPEVCVHTAWITTPGVYLESPENEKFRDASADFLRRIRACGTNHIVGLGTCVEYQITDQPLSEELTPLEPTTTYARCKNELRLRLEAEAAAEGFGFCWGRVFYPYGPGEHPSRLCSSILQKLSAAETITLRTPASTKDYIFIEDLAAALLTVVEKRFRGTINLGTGQGVSVGEIARRLGALLGRAQLVQEAVVPAADPFPFVVADAGKLKSLGWSQAVSLEDGLSRLVRSQLRSLISF